MSLCSDTIDNIIKKIFEPADRLLQKQIDKLTILNTDKTRDPENIRFMMFPAKYGFVHKDLVFISSEGEHLAKNKNNYYSTYKWNPLDANLIPQYNEIEDLYNIIKKNKEYLPRLFACLLQGAVTFTDVKNKLPDDICKLIDIIGEKSKPFEVPKHVEPLWMLCKDDLEYLMSLRLLV